MTPDLLKILLWFNSGLVLVLMLRKIWHRTSSPAHAYRLWVLPLLLVITALIPLGAEVRILHVTTLPALTEPVRSSVAVWSVSNFWVQASIWIPWVSLSGSLLLGLLMARQHRALTRRLTTSAPTHVEPSMDDRCPGLKIRRADFGPALVGITSPVLVLPLDFESRFSARQQTLAIAHEVAHWRSGDLPVRTAAWMMAILQWWNPLAWWSLARFIEDQELANDARVLAEWPDDAHHYAGALVQASSTPIPALVCAMQPTHPLLWRISMLKTHATRQTARPWMTCLTGLTLVSLTGLALALDPAPKTADANPFTVTLDVQIDDDPSSHFALAGPAGEPMLAKIDAHDSTVALEVTVTPADLAGFVLVEMNIQRDGQLIAQPKLQVAINGEGLIQAGSEKDGQFEGIRLDLRVTEGLPTPPTSDIAQPAKFKFANQRVTPPVWQSGVSWLNTNPTTPDC